MHEMHLSVLDSIRAKVWELKILRVFRVLLLVLSL